MNDLNSIPCPFCGEGELNREVREEEYEYKEHTILIDQPGLYCSSCDEAILEPDDLKANRQDLQAFRSKIDGLLPPKRIWEIRKSLGLSQKQAASIFGGGHNAFSRYECGELPPPRSLSLLLKLLDSHKELLEETLKNH